LIAISYANPSLTNSANLSLATMQ